MDKHFLRRLIVHAHCPRDNPSEAKIRTRRNADNTNRDPINDNDLRVDSVLPPRGHVRGCDILDLGNLKRERERDFITSGSRCNNNDRCYLDILI